MANENDEEELDLPPPVKMELSELEIAKVEERSTSKTRGYTKLRIEAMAAYLHDPECSIRDVHKMEKFKLLDHKTIERWASEDEWVEKRSLALQKVKNKIANEIGRSLANNIYREVCDLYELKTMAVDVLKSGEVKPKSWEAVAKLTLDINKRLSDLAMMVNDKVIDETGKMVESKGKSGMGLLPEGAQVDPKEAREIANLIMQKRRDEMRAANGTDKSPDESITIEHRADPPSEDGDVSSIPTDSE